MQRMVSTLLLFVSTAHISLCKGENSLSPAGRKLVNDFRDILDDLRLLVKKKNGDELLQDFVWGTRDKSEGLMEDKDGEEVKETKEETKEEAKERVDKAKARQDANQGTFLAFSISRHSLICLFSRNPHQNTPSAPPHQL